MRGIRIICVSLVSTVISSLAVAAQLAPSSPGWLEIDVPSQRPQVNEETLAEGRRIYEFRCAACHGVDGDGEGPVAKYLDPRPRDFTLANFKMRTTAFGELPLDEDLFRTVTRGIPGTAMPSWAPLPPDERWKVIYYLKAFADFFEDPDFDPRRVDDGETFTFDVPKAPPSTPEMIEYGREVYLRAGCAECHGKAARGNGTSAGTQFTARRHRIFPRDIEKKWRYKGGSRVEDIWKTLTTGLNGTPMPSMIGTLDDEDPKKDESDRWAVSYYVRSLLVDIDEQAPTTLEVPRVQGSLPSDPDDEAWDTAGEISFRMFGQVTKRPRWQTPAVDFMRVRALYDSESIAFRLEYSDRTESTTQEDEEIFAEDTTYPVLDVTRYDHLTLKFGDLVVLQFPSKPTDGAQRPYFLHGQSGQPVVQWRYSASESRFDERIVKGAGRQKSTGWGRLRGEAKYDDGRWRVVMQRSLVATQKGDVDFASGGYVPFLAMAWDGGNGESGLRHSLSSWYTLHLEAPISRDAWGLAFAGLLLAFAFEWMLLRRARREGAEPSPGEADAVS